MLQTILFYPLLFHYACATTIKAWSAKNELLGEVSACSGTILSENYPSLHRYEVIYNSAHVCWANDYGQCLFVSKSSGYINYYQDTSIFSGYIACGALGCDEVNIGC
ncbi:hypothetical protein OIDMADRAFT_20639 [Oidiodendron maius Zn]|uniref:Secreted protein n=1 Tax=Oidiodendron maius (strain Zn) TaxID=913774 RepID=A0A0C3D474_OIDMZ|nr:hypothetical protein OIDMADRAFT_20639 [Oidiodendron maius Zn]